MRLIDENVLLKEFKALISAYRQIEGKHNWGDHCRIPAFEFMDALKNAKNIEAIPVEWLLEWEHKYNESLPQLFRGETVIKDVIRDWRSEHETD